jgi:hypothetical protein
VVVGAYGHKNTWPNSSVAAPTVQRFGHPGKFGGDLAKLCSITQQGIGPCRPHVDPFICPAFSWAGACPVEDREACRVLCRVLKTPSSDDGVCCECCGHAATPTTQACGIENATVDPFLHIPNPIVRVPSYGTHGAGPRNPKMTLI